MNIYILTKEPFPFGMAAVNRIKCYAKAILSENIKCKVLIYSRSDVNSQLAYKGIVDGISYEYIGGSSKRMKCSLLGRLQSFYLQIYLLFYLLFKLEKNDVILGYGKGSQIIWRFLLKIVHAKKAFYISELCELPYGTSKETTKTIKCRKYDFKYLFPLYDGVIAISDALVDVAHKYTNSKCIIKKIPILVDFAKYNSPNKVHKAEFPYIFHSGTLYEQKDGILGMIEAFGIATNQINHQLHFVLTGSIEKSPHRDDINKLIDKYNLHDVIHFTGYLSNEDLREKLSRAFLVIINKTVTQQNKYCFSTKLAEYMAAGKPIIITRVGEAMNWLKDKYDCLIVEPNDIIKLSETILEVFNNFSQFIILGDNARKSCCEYFGYENYGILLKKMFTDLQTKDEMSIKNNDIKNC